MQYLVRSASGLARASGSEDASRPAFSASGLRAQLRSQDLEITPQFQNELESLGRETDPELLGESLYSLAARCERQDRMPLAAAVYAFLAQASGLPALESLNRRASRRLAAIEGGGSIGDRAEVFLGRFVRDVTDPGLLLGMAVGAGVFRATRLLAMSRLGAAGLSPVATRVLANAAGFVAEAPSFVVATRGVHAALGAHENAAPLGREILSAYIFLGAMKASGAAASGLHRRWIGPVESLSTAGSLSSRLFPQVGMLGGVMLSHRAEQELGLRPRQSFAALIGESLATLVHLNASGRIFHQLTGPGFRRWEQAVDLRTEALARPRPLFTENFSAMGMLPAVASVIVKPGELQGEIIASGTRSGSDVVPKAPAAEIHQLAEVPIPEIVRQFIELWRTEETLLPQVDLGEGFNRRVAEWGYQWQESKTRDYGAELAFIRSMHERLDRGGVPEPADLRYLEDLISRAQDELTQFETHRRILTRVVDFSRHGQAKQSRGESMAIDRVLHDLSHRPQFLQLMMLAANDLQAGVRLDEYYLQSLSPRSGFPLGQSVKEGITMASAESPELATRVWKALHVDALDDFHLAQGSQAARGLGDILANFVTNAWRYRRSDDVAVRFDATRLIDGTMRITVGDDGIGIEPQNLASLGSHGFRESRVDLSTSHGYGLASVISNLRRLNWGPLWVKSRVGEGTEFQFEIPAEHLAGSAVDEIVGNHVDRWGQGPETRLENRLNAGFTVPAASLDLAIRQLIEEIPASAYANESFGPGELTRPRVLKNGLLRHRRMEIFHRLLAGSTPPEELTVVENGPGALIDNSLALLRSGSRVVVKEPDTVYLPTHQRGMRGQFDAEQLARMEYVSPAEIDRSTPADVVYWPNPDAHRIVRPSGVPLGEYLGRDVQPGGYLVVQSDHHFGAFRALKDLRLAPAEWEKVYDMPLEHRENGSNQVLVTAQSEDLYLQVYRRRR